MTGGEPSDDSEARREDGGASGEVDDDLVRTLRELEAAALAAADAAEGEGGLATGLFETWAHTAYTVRQDYTTDGYPEVPTLAEYLDFRGRL